MKHLPFASALLVLSACAASSTTHAPPPPQAFVAPDLAGGHWRFDATSYHHGDEPARPTPDGAGPPLAMATDLATGWTAVAYRSHLAALLHFGGDVEWHAADFSGGVPALASGAELAGSVVGDRVQVHALESGALLWARDASEWRRETGVDRLHAAVPLDAQRAVLVASRASSMFGANAAAVLARVSVAGGRLATESSSEVTSLTHVQGVANHGARIFVAGTKEAYQMGAGTGLGRSLVSLVVVRYDATTGTATEVVRNLEHERGQALRALIAGRDESAKLDLLALLLEDGQVRVFTCPEAGTTSAPTFEILVPGAEAIAWIDVGTLAVVAPGGTQTFRVR